MAQQKKMTQAALDKVYETRLALTKTAKDEIEKEFPIYVWKNKDKTIRSTDRKTNYKVIEKRLTKTTNFQRAGMIQYFTFAKSTSARLEFQEYRVEQRIDDNGHEHFCFDLINLVRFTNDGITKINCDSLNGKAAHVYSGLRGIQLFVGSFESCLVAPNHTSKATLNKTLSNGPFKYIDISRLPINCSCINWLAQLERAYKLRDKIEYLQKLGNSDAVNDTINDLFNGSIDLRTLSWKRLKAIKSKIKEGYSLDMLLFQKRLEDEIPDAKLTPQYARNYNGNVYYEPTVHILTKVHDEAKVGYVKLQNYICKNKIYPLQYEEYLDGLDFLEIPLTKSLAMPKSFDKAFVEVRAERQKKEDETTAKLFEKTEKKKTMFNASYGGLVFFVPETESDLIKEGLTLNNCLASYVSRLANDKTTVLFVRKSDAPNKSLYAMEISNQNRLVQVRAKYNKPAEKADQDIVNDYIKNYYIPKKKEYRAASVA